MTTIVLNAPDISCDHCQRAIEGAVGALAGVSKVAVDIEAKAVTVDFDDAVLSQAAIEEAMDEEGYPVTH